MILHFLNLLIILALGGFLYIRSAIFKKMGELSIIKINEGEDKPEEKVNEADIRVINKVGIIAFLLVGALIWILLGIGVGKVTTGITDNNILKWLTYLAFYFIFLRFPFGVANRTIKRIYEFKAFPEKVLFAIVMIAGFFLGIYYFDSLPWILKFHMIFINE